MERSKVINFADDTVVFLPGKTHLEIEQGLNFDLVNISNYFYENELVINLKPGKTESMLFATGRKLSQNKKPLKLEYKSQTVVSTAENKYLGIILDKTLSFSSNFYKVYKKTSGKLRLLESLKRYLPPDSLTKLCKGILLPALLYNCTTNLNLTNTQLQKLNSLDRRVGKVTSSEQTPIANEIKKHALLLVKKCLNGKVCEIFDNFFEIRTHEKTTRDNGFLLQVPKVRLQLSKSCFRSVGVKFYNSLPIEHRQVECTRNFRDLVTKYFLNCKL